MPPDFEEYYGFSSFAMELNNLNEEMINTIPRYILILNVNTFRILTRLTLRIFLFIVVLPQYGFRLGCRSFLVL